MVENSLLVCEQFCSIQGESTWAGLPCLFLRLAGCNLRCSHCDTSYSWEETAGTETTQTKILQWIEEYPGIMIELTGGEPLLQESTYPLMNKLLKMGRQVLIETNGSIAVDKVPLATNIIMDIKCPGSGMDSKNNWANVSILSSRSQQGCQDNVKFVVSSKDDFLWAREVVNRYKLNTIVPVLFSPNTNSIAPANLAELILQFKLNVRLQLQLHKILWPDRDRGV